MNTALIVWIASWCLAPDVCYVEQEKDVAVVEWYTDIYEPHQKDLGWIDVGADEKFRIFLDIKNHQADIDQSI